MSVTVIFKDPHDNIIKVDVDWSITIGELRKVYSSKGGEGNNQMKINAEIVEDNKRLEDYIVNKKIKKNNCTSC